MHSSHPRKLFASFSIVALVATLLAAVASVGTAGAAPSIIASALVPGGPVNQVSHTNPWAGAFSSAGDGFEIYNRATSPTIPFAVLDDSLSIFPPDSLGIIKEGNLDDFFGVVDTINADNSSPVSASWVFDISDASALSLNIDMGAMGDFEASDTFTWSYSIDGGGAITAFAGVTDEAGSQTYVLEGGGSFTLNDPMQVGGTNLTNDLATFSTTIPGTGDELTLTLTAEADGGTEAVAFQNLEIIGEAFPTLIITGVVDGPLSGGTPKAIELLATNDIADLSTWGVGSANNGGGSDGEETTLSGSATAGQYLYVASESVQFTNFFGFAPDFTGAAAFINGDDAIELFNDGTVVDTFGDIDVDGTGQPWEYLDGWACRLAGTGPDGSTFVLGNWAFSGPNALDGETTNATAATPFPLGDTACEEPSEPIPLCQDTGLSFTRIHDVQGAGASSPLDGQTVTIEGIVVGDFQEVDTSQNANNTSLGGFMVQEEDADVDADPATSEGIFVFDPDGDPAVAVGDLVRVRGPVSEFFGLTEITGNEVDVCSSGATAPTPAQPTLPTAVGDPLVDWEAIEGMSVVFGQDLTVTGLFPLGRFGEVQLSAIGAQDHPNQVHPVGSTAAADQAQLNLDSRVILDDGENENESFPSGLSTWNPAPTPYLFDVDLRDPSGDTGGTIRDGDVISNLSGVVHFSFGEYEVQPVNVADPLRPSEAVTPSLLQPRPPSPTVSGDLKVSSFNVLNYFTTIDTGGAQCGPLLNQGCRGADTAAEFDTQAAKIVAALTELDADVVGVIEIENAPDDTPIADLVARLNASSSRSYDYIPTGPIGGDAIRAGIIYDVITVAPAGIFAVLDSSFSPAYLDDFNRPALAQSFEQVGTGEVFTVVVNHLKSKGSPCDSVVNPGDAALGIAGYTSDPDTGVFAGNCNLTRLTAAQVEIAWLDTDPTGQGTDRILVTGDLNAYANEDPILAFEAAGYLDLVEAITGGTSWADAAHTFVFDGEHGSLDYALASPAIVSAVTGVEDWHINADEPFAIDYQNFNPPGNAQLDQYKSSDHDPVVVGLDLDDNRPLCAGLPVTILGTNLADVIVGTSVRDIIWSGNGTDTVSGLGGPDVICAGNGVDQVDGGDGADQIFGQNGDDNLSGGPGNDLVDGGRGFDTIDGGPDIDTCVRGEAVSNCES